TLLRNGTVLVAGGLADPFDVLSSAEVYEPVTGAWAEVAPMKFPCTGCNATLLPDGQVLVVGGLSSLAPSPMVSSSAELYQPSGNTNAVPARPRLINSRMLVNGSFEFRFVSLPSRSFAVLATTNASLPSNDWTVLGRVTEFASGLYQFTDANA